jgi:hypothetical protein
LGAGFIILTKEILQDMNEKTISWSFSSSNKTHSIELHIWPFSGKKKIIIDDSIVFKQRFKILRQDRAYQFWADKIEIEIEVNDKLPYLDTCENDKLKYDCYVNGISLNSGTGKKSKEEKLIEKNRQERKAWEQVQSKGLINYLLRQLRFIFVFVILIWIVVLSVDTGDRWNPGIIFLWSLISIILLIAQLFSNILEWRKNCKKQRNG